MPVTCRSCDENHLACRHECFFAAVECLRDPELAGLPLVVGGQSHNRGQTLVHNFVAPSTQAGSLGSKAPCSQLRQTTHNKPFDRSRAGAEINAVRRGPVNGVLCSLGKEGRRTAAQFKFAPRRHFPNKTASTNLVLRTESRNACRFISP